MPCGLVRSGDFRNGTPIVLPHQFGNVVAGSNEPFGNAQPQSNPRISGNPVDWTPSPAHFGNQVSFSLQTVPPVIVVSPGSTGTTDINLTNLLGSNSAELTYFGEPTGVSIAFGTNPDTGSSVATVTVGSGVPAGRYTITIVGTVASPNIEYVQLQLVVASAGSGPPPAGVALVAHAAASGTFVSPITTTGVDTTGANFLVAVISAFDSGTQTGISDSFDNTWESVSLGTTNATPRIFYVYNPTVGPDHTVTFTSADGSGIAFAAFSGLNNTSSVFETGTNVFNDNVESGTTVQAGSNTPNASGDLVIAGLGGIRITGPVSIDSGFTICDNIGASPVESSAAISYLVTTSTSSENPTWTVAANGNRIGASSAIFAAA